MIDYANVLATYYSGKQWSLVGDEYIGLDWKDASPKPTQEELDTLYASMEAQAPLDACKAEAKQRLADTDWSVLPDVVVKNKLEFETYRSQIRALVLNPVADPVWPTEPQPVWS